MTYSLFPDSSLAVQREIVEANLNATAEVQAPTHTDVKGDHTKSWVTVLTISCRLGLPAGTVERVIGEQVQETGRVLVIFPAGTAIRSEDRRLLVSWTENEEPRVLLLNIIGRLDVHSYATQSRYLCEVVG